MSIEIIFKNNHDDSPNHPAPPCALNFYYSSSAQINYTSFFRCYANPLSVFSYLTSNIQLNEPNFRYKNINL